jgi:hypothetical protein
VSDIEISGWRKCSSCKKPIGWDRIFYKCSVSTCNGERTGYVFCSVACFEVHLPGARHRDAAAVESRSPATASSQVGTDSTHKPQRLIVKSSTAQAISSVASAKIPTEVLIIASRLKEYIQARGDMNTAAAVMDTLSDHVRRISDQAVDNARADGRKTVMERDFEFLDNIKL